MWECLSGFLSIIPTFPLSAQTDARLIEALRLAQSGQVDSGRAIVRRLLATLTPGDSVFPQALLAAAKIGAQRANSFEQSQPDRRRIRREPLGRRCTPAADPAVLRPTRPRTDRPGR